MISYWIIISFAIVGVLTLLCLVKGIIDESTRPGCAAHQYHHDEPALRKLNILTNVLFATSGVIFMVAGYPAEAISLFLLTMASTFWHGTHEPAWRIADHVFCVVTAILFLGVFYRLVCINGWPLLSVLYIALIVAGAVCFSQHELHPFWHILVAMFVFALGIETLYSPGLISSAVLRATVQRALQYRIQRQSSCNHTVMLADLFRKSQNGSMIMQ
jgi:hypothetical protein